MTSDSRRQNKKNCTGQKISGRSDRKDYALSWLLYGIYSSKLKDILVFKGGTALSKIYFPKTWRLSEDLDFTVADNAHDSKIKPMLEDCFEALNEKSGMAFSHSEFHAAVGHIIAAVQFSGPLGKNSIRIDISLDETLVEVPFRKKISDEYPDIEKFDILVYSLDEIFAEKLRSILQRGKSRDYFDVWMLLNKGNFDKAKIKELFIKKCEYKNIEPSYGLFFETTKLNEARDFWKTGLARLMNDVPEFEAVISDLKKGLEFLKD